MVCPPHWRGARRVGRLAPAREHRCARGEDPRVLPPEPAAV